MKVIGSGINLGGISLTKSIIGVTIDTGSTVGLYSDAALTTLVKLGVEMSQGMYVISGIGNGTYWIQSIKNGSVASKQIVISSAGVYAVTLSYALHLITNGVVNPMHELQKKGQQSYNITIADGYINVVGLAAGWHTPAIRLSIQDVYSTIHYEYESDSAEAYFGCYRPGSSVDTAGVPSDYISGMHRLDIPLNMRTDNNIEAVYGDYYIGMSVPYHTNLKIYNLWLE